jgi:ABC-type glycerol-3-phosphate transport system substrate-binding protein
LQAARSDQAEFEEKTQFPPKAAFSQTGKDRSLISEARRGDSQRGRACIGFPNNTSKSGRAGAQWRATTAVTNGKAMPEAALKDAAQKANAAIAGQ